MNVTVLLIIAIIAGFGLPVQAGINASLAKHLHSSIQAGFISFSGGLLMMILVAVCMGHFLPAPKQILQTPPYLLLGGIIGGIMVVTSILLAPKIGAVSLIACFVCGQLICSVILDHYGWVGFRVHPINMMRIIGVLFLLCGVFLIQRY